MDDIISQESLLDMEGNYKKVRGESSFVCKQSDHFSNWEKDNPRGVARFHTLAIAIIYSGKLNAQNRTH